MKSFVILSTALLLTGVLSCTSSDKKTNEGISMENKPIDAGKKKPENYKPENIPGYKLYPITLGDTFSINRNIEKALHADTLHIKIEKPGTISGKLLVASDKANLRFEKIIEPSGKTEGPFSKTFSYKVDRSETIMVLVNASQMAEAAYSGPYRVYLELEK